MNVACVAYTVKYWFCKGLINGCSFDGDVYGSDPYTIDSSICKAGLHKGLIDKSGGFVKQIVTGNVFLFISHIFL